MKFKLRPKNNYLGTGAFSGLLKIFIGMAFEMEPVSAFKSTSTPEVRTFCGELQLKIRESLDRPNST